MAVEPKKDRNFKMFPQHVQTSIFSELQRSDKIVPSSEIGLKDVTVRTSSTILKWSFDGI